MALTLADIRGAVNAKGHQQLASDPTLAELARGALRRAYGAKRWKFLRATATVALPALGESIALAPANIPDLRSIEAVYLQRTDGGYTELTAASPDEVRDQVLNDRTADMPEFFALQGSANTLLFYPRADIAYSLVIDYIQRPTLPLADSDTVVWPDAYLDVLVWAVVKDLAYRQRDWWAMREASSEFDRVWGECVGAYAISHRTTNEVRRWAGWQEVSL